MGGDGGVETPVLVPYVCRDGHPDVNVAPPDMALIQAAPDLAQGILRLLPIIRLCAGGRFEDDIRFAVAVLLKAGIAETGMES